MSLDHDKDRTMLSTRLSRALLPLSLVALPGGEDLTFGPPEGTTLVKSFETEVELTGGEMEVIMGDQEVPPEFLPELEVTMAESRDLVFTDHYAEVSSGRVALLRRSFDRIEEQHQSSQSLSGQGMDDAAELATTGSSRLEDETVLFRWDGDEEQYTAQYPDEDGDPALLEGLEFAADFVALLPEDEVEAGDSWRVDGEVFACLVTPGGDLSVEYEGDDEESLNEGEREVTYEGSLELTLKGIFEEDGRRIASVEIEGEVIETQVQRTDLANVPVADGTAVQTVTLEHALEGELEWDLEAGHLLSLQLESSIDATLEVVRDADQPGQHFEFCVYMVGEGRYAAEFESER